ncbi:hypothetical protein [Gimesia sp.]|uniref:hypothetical protein n=1 Tax=Gimesia sp. TaxID=2024833 RepID=UPI0032ED6601
MISTVHNHVTASLTLACLIYLSLASCSDPSAPFAQIQDAKTEAKIFQEFAADKATYEITFFDSTGDKLNYSNANPEILDSVTRISINTSDGTEFEHQVHDPQNLKLLLVE